MANPNPPIDPDIAEKGKATRFGQPDGPDPVAAAKSEEKAASWSIRGQLKYLAAQPLNIGEKGENLDQELNRLRYTEGKETTSARLIALRQIERSIKKGDVQSAQFVTENIEGKLTQVIVIPEKKMANEEPGSLEEAARIYKETISQ